MRFSVHPTVNAIQVIDGVRRLNAANMPFVAWKVLLHAQQRLERELNDYLHEDLPRVPVMAGFSTPLSLGWISPPAAGQHGMAS